MKKNLLLGSVAVALVLLIAGGYWYFARYRPQQAQRAYSKAVSTANEFHHEGKVDEGIAAYEEALKLAPTQGSATYIKLKIAYDVFVRNQGNDRRKAVEMYKEIILNEKEYAFQRASSISDLMDLYNATHDEEFARDVIFSGEPFEKFVAEAQRLGYRNDLEYAVRRAYEVADDLYPLSLSELRIAAWYLGALDSGRANAQQHAEFLAQLKKWTEKAEANLPAYLRLGFEKSKIGYLHQLDGLDRRALAKYGDKNYAPAEAAFKDALDVLATSPKGVHEFGVAMFVRFHYAGMLSEIYGTQRRGDIEELIRGIVNIPGEIKDYPFPFYEFLKNEVGSEHDVHGHKQDILRLRTLVPEFKTFTDRLGIRY